MSAFTTRDSGSAQQQSAAPWSTAPSTNAPPHPFLSSTSAEKNLPPLTNTCTCESCMKAGLRLLPPAAYLPGTGTRFAAYRAVHEPPVQIAGAEDPVVWVTQSITRMTEYANKSFEELRVEDYSSHSGSRLYPGAVPGTTVIPFWNKVRASFVDAPPFAFGVGQLPSDASTTVTSTTPFTASGWSTAQKGTKTTLQELENLSLLDGEPTAQSHALCEKRLDAEKEIRAAEEGLRRAAQRRCASLEAELARVREQLRVVQDDLATRPAFEAAETLLEDLADLRMKLVREEVMRKAAEETLARQQKEFQDLLESNRKLRRASRSLELSIPHQNKTLPASISEEQPKQEPATSEV